LFETALYEDLPIILAIDGVALVMCTVLLLRYGRLAHSHPAVCYLFFHSVAVTSRLLAIMAGADTMFTSWGGLFEPVADVEIGRAVFLADVVLVVMTVAWIRASLVDAKQPHHDNSQPVTLSLQHIWRVAAIAFPVGVIGLALVGSVPLIDKPEVDLGEWRESSWLVITTTWAGLALLALIYWYGFRWWLITPMGLYLFLMMIQGFHRFRAIIPLILLLQIYLDRKQRRWPPLIATIPIIFAMLLFYPMKTIGRMTQEGASISEITRSSSEIIGDVMAGQNGDQTILDQLACTLTLIDRAGKLYYGSTYMALVTSPIPRQLWPDKPGLAEHMKEFSTPSRPMAELGMIMTFIGEFYLNFGYAGIVVMSYLTAYWLARIYFRAYRSNYFSALRFVYLMIACNFIQVYRDGMMSLFIFTVVNMMPLTVIVVLHYVWPVRRRDAAAPLYGIPLSSK
jgi:hypothetical protein